MAADGPRRCQNGTSSRPESGRDRDRCQRGPAGACQRLESACACDGEQHLNLQGRLARGGVGNRYLINLAQTTTSPRLWLAAPSYLPSERPTGPVHRRTARKTSQWGKNLLFSCGPRRVALGRRALTSGAEKRGALQSLPLQACATRARRQRLKHRDSATVESLPQCGSLAQVSGLDRRKERLKRLKLAYMSSTFCARVRHTWRPSVASVAVFLSRCL